MQIVGPCADARCALLETVEEEDFGKTYILRDKHSGKQVNDVGLDFFFVDTKGIKEQLEEWLQAILYRKKKTSHNKPNLLPLFIDGLVKVRSCADSMQDILPLKVA